MKIGLPILLIIVPLFTGCVMWQQRRQGHATSVVQFLYPKDHAHTDTPGIPVLSLPLRVGIAFAPPAEKFGNAIQPTSEMAKVELLKRVADAFRGLPYVKSIEVIPTTYLRPGGSFENLEQVKTMFGVDVVALVAYDQVQFTHEGLLSIAYWTIVGAYIVQGERNDTQTLMESVVYDIKSRKLLFRAPGASQVKASSTPINQSEQLRIDSKKGFDLATAEMTANLKNELESFKTRIKEAPADFKIEHKPGYSGAGSLDAWLAVCASGLALFAWGRRLTSVSPC